MFVQTALVALLITAESVLTLDNGIGATPAMGWNSWTSRGCRVSERDVRKAVEYLSESGLASLGYDHVVIDDCWQLTRDSNGQIHEDGRAFPSGMKALVRYVHSKGLKVGLYSSAGTFTCQGRPGSLSFETKDAKTYASWGVDYLKYDNCNNDGLSDRKGTIKRYGAMRDALNATGRHINYAISNWGQADIWEYGDTLGNSWRTSEDVEDSWQSVIDAIKVNALLSKLAKPGAFNDMDVLQVGNGGMTYEEYRTQFTLWAILKSPLFLSQKIQSSFGDTINPGAYEILSNPDIIAINQDKLGMPAILRASLDSVLLWVGELNRGERILVVLNTGSRSVDVDVSLSAFTVKEEDAIASQKWRVSVRDLWARKVIGTAKSKIKVAGVAPHSVKAYKVTLKGPDVVFPSLSTASPFHDHPIQYSETGTVALVMWSLFFSLIFIGVAWALYKLHLERRAGYEVLR
ncbi:hypothetical protein HDU77_011840 [Chytriomyces hyalinus]|nr:hypothetical protein HDU77_011840 [Chytriomyces hyalinus]